MKKFLMVVVFFLIIIFVFLQFFLGKTIKTVVEKNAGQFLNAKVELNSLSFNILGGSLDLRGLKIYNPQGFSEAYLYSLERSYEDLGLLSLLKKQIVIEDIIVKNSDFIAVRSKEGKFNFKEVVKAQEKKKEGPKGEAVKEEKKEDKGVKEEKEGLAALPAFLLKNMNITSTVTYIDYKISQTPFEIGFETEVNAKDLATFGPETRKGVFTVKGHLKGSKAEFLIDVMLEAQPLVDPKNPTFILSAEIKSVDMKRLAAYKGATGIEEGRLALTSKVVCVNGEIQRESSLQALHIKELKVTDEVKNSKLKGQTPPSEIQFGFHLYGRVESPENDFWLSFLKALLNPTSLIKSQLGDALGGGEAGMAGGLGAGILGGGAASSETKEEDKTQENSLLGTLIKVPVKEEAKAEGAKEEPKVEKKSPLSGLVGGSILGTKNESNEEEAKPDQEEKKSLPFGGAKKLF